MALEATPSPPTTWQKAQIIGVILASLAIPVVIAVLGNSYSKTQKEQEIGAHYVELAIGILRSEPAKGSKALRSWAVSIVDHFSPIALPADAKTELELQQLLVELQAETQQTQERLLLQIGNELKRLHDEAAPPLNKVR